jgi:hypothetical protein
LPEELTENLIIYFGLWDKPATVVHGIIDARVYDNSSVIVIPFDHTTMTLAKFLERFILLNFSKWNEPTVATLSRRIRLYTRSDVRS